MAVAVTVRRQVTGPPTVELVLSKGATGFGLKLVGAQYNDFDIILDHFQRVSRPYALHATLNTISL